MGKKGICALYSTEAELRNSHFIPQFIFDYMKKTGSKFMRKLDEPEKRIQDGPKDYLLSEKAEQEFSKRERWFANNIFHPYQKEEKLTFSYDENMAYFVISVAWRILREQMKHPAISGDTSLNFLSDVEREWRYFLKDSIFPINYNDLNVFMTSRVESHDSDSSSVDYYITRSIDATIATNEDSTLVVVYFKFLRFIFWSVVKGPINDDSHQKIKFDKGEIRVPQIINDGFLGGFLPNRIKTIDNRPKPSKKRQEKIMKELEKSGEDFWNSDAGKSMLNDFELEKSKNG